MNPDLCQLQECLDSLLSGEEATIELNGFSCLRLLHFKEFLQEVNHAVIVDCIYLHQILCQGSNVYVVCALILSHVFVLKTTIIVN